MISFLICQLIMHIEIITSGNKNYRCANHYNKKHVSFFCNESVSSSFFQSIR